MIGRSSLAARNLLLALGLGAAAGCGSAAAPAASGSAARLAWERCERVPVEGVRCARLTVPENRADPRSSRTIALRIVRLPATGSDRAPDAVFFLAGGPGQAASEFLQHPSVEAFRQRRDVVFADQRGTGGSRGLSCEVYGPPEDAQSYFDGFLPAARIRACRERLQRETDLAQYTTAASVEDLDDVREALGYGRMNLVGSSYGTRLAMEYVRRFESRVRTVVLDGAVPPSVPVPEGFGALAEGGLNALLDECLAAECGASFPNIRDEARAVFARLRAGSVTATVSHPAAGRPAQVTLTRDHVGEAIRYMTYTPRTASRVPLYLHQAAAGDYSPIADFLMRWRADGRFDGLYLSITCTEDVPFVAGEAAARDEGTYLGGYRVREQQRACREWARGAVPASHREPVRANVPALLTAGVLDPVTPPRFAEEIARTLPNSRVIQVPSGAHSMNGLIGLECLDALKRDFVETGKVHTLDVSCVARIRRPPFVVR